MRREKSAIRFIFIILFLLSFGIGSIFFSLSTAFATDLDDLVIEFEKPSKIANYSAESEAILLPAINQEVIESANKDAAALQEERDRISENQEIQIDIDLDSKPTPTSGPAILLRQNTATLASIRGAFRPFPADNPH